MADEMLEVVYPDEDFRRDTYFIHPDAYDPDEHELAEGETAPGEGQTLEGVVGTRQANALADAGLTTVEEALEYDGDLTELDGVGQGTVDDLLEAAEE